VVAQNVFLTASRGLKGAGVKSIWIYSRRIAEVNAKLRRSALQTVRSIAPYL
jgi:hypothetical protein